MKLRHWGMILGGVALLGALVSIVVRKQFSVPTIAAKKGAIVEAVFGIGTVTAYKNYQLKLGVAGTIEKLFVVEGGHVAANAPLIRIEPGTIFRAPFPGTITSLPFQVGETIFPQTPIVTLTDLHDTYVVVSLEQQGALRVRKGQSARLSFESIRGQKFSGKVRTIFPNEGQFYVHIDPDPLPSEILPGMTADVAIEIAHRDNVLLVPANAITAGKVVVSREGHKSKVDLQIGTVDGEWAEVLSGDIHEGDAVVVKTR